MWKQNLIVVAWIVGLVGLAGGGYFFGNKWLERDERKHQAAKASTRLEPLVEATAQFRTAVEKYKTRMMASGVPLPPGKIISLEDLESSEVLQKKDIEPGVEVKKFAYVILPFDASDATIQMVLVTDKGRSTMNKKGEGFLYGK